MDCLPGTYYHHLVPDIRAMLDQYIYWPPDSKLHYKCHCKNPTCPSPNTHVFTRDRFDHILPSRLRFEMISDCLIIHDGVFDRRPSPDSRDRLKQNGIVSPTLSWDSQEWLLYEQHTLVLLAQAAYIAELISEINELPTERQTLISLNHPPSTDAIAAKLGLTCDEQCRGKEFGLFYFEVWLIPYRCIVSIGRGSRTHQIDVGFVCLGELYEIGRSFATLGSMRYV